MMQFVGNASQLVIYGWCGKLSILTTFVLWMQIVTDNDGDGDDADGINVPTMVMMMMI